MKENYIKGIPGKPAGKGRKTKQPVPFVPSDEELANLFRASNELPVSPGDSDMRLRSMQFPVMLRLMESSGLSPKELLMLRNEDVELDSGVIHVHSRDSCDEHRVVIHKTMLSMMVSYDMAVGDLQGRRQWFFADREGSPYSLRWLNGLFRAAWLKYNQRPSDGSRLSSSMLRHDYIIRNMNSWVDGDPEENLLGLLALSKSLGHRNLGETLSLYRMSKGMSDVMDKLVVDDYNSIIPHMEGGVKTEKLKEYGKER